jgi:hypothetical protein
MRSIAPFIKVLTYRYYCSKPRYGDIALKEDNKTGKYQREGHENILQILGSYFSLVSGGQTPNSRSNSFFVSRATFVIVCPLLVTYKLE